MRPSQNPASKQLNKKTAIKFVILLGVVSLFADITYEGARSITGPYLAVLGASATVVGFVAGFGELVGYVMRIGSGYLADKTAQYWLITIIGYICTLLAVPLLALTHRWETAAFLIVLERFGKAIRTPARDALLSYGAKTIGVGWGFGLHEALDQTGAMLGPLLMAVILFFKGSYHESFAFLALPAIIALSLLMFARWLFPKPHHLSIKLLELHPHVLKTLFWFYLCACSLIAAGYADFPLIAYHFEKLSVLSPNLIPISYAVAMGFEAISALILGYLYDRVGIVILIFVTLLSSAFAPLVFLGSERWVFLGMSLWGIGMGGQGSILKAFIADIVSPAKIASAYGIFNTGFGIFWFLGSVVMGKLYEISIPVLIAFSMILQISAIPFLLIVIRSLKKKH